MNYSIDSNGYYGEFGGAYIPEILHRCVSQLQEACRTILPSDDFKREFEDLLKHYVGRPSPPLSRQTPVREIRLQGLPQARRPEPHRCP